MLDLLYKRRSIRKYQQIPVEREKIEQLTKAALLAPSAKSAMSQKFIIIEDKKVLEELSHVRDHASSYLRYAPLAIVVLGDSDVIDVWTEDTSIAATIIQLTATSLGLGSCWIQIRNRMHAPDVTAEDYVKKLLSIPDQLKVECMIALGYPLEPKPAKTDEDLGENRVFYNNYRK
jgi:nitroreductase